MRPMRQHVQNYLVEASADQQAFTDNLSRLVDKDGARACQAIIYTLTSLDMKPDEAQKTWYAILDHFEQMKEALDNEVHLVTAMSDYLCSRSKSLVKPRLVEICTFDRVMEESTHDRLTGLFNRAYFDETLEQQLSFAQRQTLDMSVLFIDVDDFKDINDTRGHICGDFVLQSIAQMLKEEARTSDIVARYGGEEFIILMPDTDYISALVFGERVRQKIASKEFTCESSTFKLTISGGLASYPMHATNSEDLLNLADSALYRAKGAGKNNISLFKQDNRRFLRIKHESEVKIKDLGFTDSAASLGLSKNICIGGILFVNTKALDIGAMIQVSIRMHIDEDPLLLIGTVVRVEVLGQEEYDIGMTISFKEMDKTAKNGISKFLLAQSKGASL